MLREPSYLDETLSEDRPSGSNVKVFKEIYPYLLRYPRTLILSSLSIIIASLTVLGVGVGLRYFVDQGFSDTSTFGLTGSLLILLIIIITMALASYGRLYWVSELSERVIAELRKQIFDHLLLQDMPFFEKTSIGEIQSRLTTDTTLLQIILGTSIPIALRNILIIVGGIGMLIYTSPLLTLTLLFIIPLVLVPILIYGKQVKAFSRKAQDKTSVVSSRLDETFGAIQTVLAFCREKYVSKLFSHEVEDAYRTSMMRVESRARLTAFVMILVFAGVSAVLWMGGQSVLSGSMSPGQLAAFLFYAAAVAGASGSLSEIHGDILRAAGGTERIFEFLAKQPDIKVPATPQALPSPCQGHIQFLDVSFTYPSRPDHQVLKDLSFEVKKGETVALVGPSGVGKTTIFNLIMRFYDPTHGQIFLDGIPTEDLNLQDLRQAIGLVPQHPTMFSTSFLENIRFGKLDATEDEVKHAAQAAYADEFISPLSKGYHTPVGEKGVALSGGQKQRIAIARAILKNPPILLLDEATSALDTESEEKVKKALANLKHDRTTLIIAHRKSTIETADRVITLHSSYSKN